MPKYNRFVCVTAGEANEFVVEISKDRYAFRIHVHTPYNKVVFLDLSNSYFKDLFSGWNWHCFTIKRDGNMSVCFKLLVFRVHSN